MNLKILESLIRLEACVILTLVGCSFAYARRGTAIGCYSCDSRNYTDPHCHDPFNPAMSKYIDACRTPKNGHIGVFPASFCVKLSGENVQTKEIVVIRACALENMDNQCGTFRFEDTLYNGCILTCDYDGCNGAIKIRSMMNPTLLFAIITASVFGFRFIIQ